MHYLKQCLGVDLGFHSVKIVELAIGKTGVRVIRAGSTPTGASPGMSPDEVNQAIIGATRDLLKKGRFSSRRAVFAISGQKVFVRRFRLPKTSEERLARIIQYEARQQIPFPLDKTILQYQHRDLPDESEVEVLLVAIRSDEVKSFMQVVNRTGLVPMAVGVSSFSLFNAHQFINLDEAERKKVFEPAKKSRGGKGFGITLPKFGKKAKAAGPNPVEEEEALSESVDDEFAMEEIKGFVNLGASVYDLAIGRTGKGEASLGFIRTVPIGGNQMTQAVQRACKVESFLDAERIKQSATQLMTFNFDFEEDSQINQDASLAVTEVADKIISDVRRSLDFFITQPDGMAIDSIMLSGGVAQLAGIESYIEEKLTVPVTVVKEVPEGSPLEWPDSAGPMTTYMIATGLALQGIGLAPVQVDFLPEDRKITRDFPYRVAAVMIALVAATAAIASQGGKEYSAKYTREAAQLDESIVRVRTQNKEFDNAQKLQDEVAQNFLDMNKVFGQRQFWMNVLEKIAEIKPPGVLILGLSMDHDGEVSVSAQSDVPVDAADFNKSLSRAFAGRLLGEPNIESMYTAPLGPGGEQPPTRFTVRLTFEDKINHLQITPTPLPEAMIPGTGLGRNVPGNPRVPGPRQGGRTIPNQGGAPLF